MNPEILKEENIKSKYVTGLINSKIDKINNSLSHLKEDSIERLKAIREQSLSYMDMLDTMESLQKELDAFDADQVFKSLNELDYLKNNPFFARIDLKEKGTETYKPYYISKFGFFDENEPILIDWRAKLASLYYKYRYPQDNVSYEVEDEKFEYDMNLKRTFEIDNSQVLKYFNNDIQLNENELIIEKIKNRTGGVLEDIVETIQESQMKIIESDPREVCIVQGCVGSGKSTVAIHKLSYIFFNYPQIIRPDRSILISKNRVLVDYLSSLFPKLGIFDLKYATTRDLLFRQLTSEGVKIKFNLGENTDISIFNSEFVDNFRSKIEQAKNECFESINVILNKEKYQDLVSFKFVNSISIFENFDDLLSEISSISNDLKEEIKENQGDSFYKERTKGVISRLKNLRGELSSKKSSILQEHFNKIINEYSLNEFLGYRESLLYLIIFREFFGFKKNQMYEYCVIDEAQDMSLIELMYLQQMVINNRFCLIGDLNQNLHNNPISKWEEIYSLFNGTKISTFLLETNYRSTKNIVDFANKVISKFTDLYLPKPIEKIGEEVVVLRQTDSEVLDFIRQAVKEDYSNLTKSVGFIFNNKVLKDEVVSILKEEISDPEKLLILDEFKKGVYTPRGIYALDFENCKGLEFNKVYLFGFDLDKVENYEEAKKAFVGVTRAMNELVIVS
jgi:DNA helicase-2/ATP-dependent DNA helicase PcrA